MFDVMLGCRTVSIMLAYHFGKEWNFCFSRHFYLEQHTLHTRYTFYHLMGSLGIRSIGLALFFVA